MIQHTKLVMLASLGWLLVGCPQGPFQPEGDDESGDAPAQEVVAGATCSGLSDCPEGQICVGKRCRYTNTSVAGEMLSAAAAAQLDAGDFGGAVRTFDEGIEAYQQASAPVPPEILCGAAVAALQEGGGQDARERAATRADACLRGSLPGDPRRAEVLEGLTRLRYEGLEPTLFDEAEPAQRFFTKEPSRPTVDAIDVRVQLPDVDEKGMEEIREAIHGEAARRAIADCFVQDWDLRHERRVQAPLILKLKSTMKDMRTYDIFKPEIEIEQTSLAEDGFEPCVAGALGSVLSDAVPKNIGRQLSWQHPFEVTARLQ
ncbi:MAG: hypothetical protein ACOCXM_09470 [Myxococcota bacterium]